MEKSTEMIACGTSKVPTWINRNGSKMYFDREAHIDEDGGVSLEEMRDDECVIAPNAIYRTESNQTGWQRAETAPKKEVFIACFDDCPLPVFCTWNEPEQQWVYSNVQVNLYQGKWNDTFFQDEFETADALIAWMPLPLFIKEPHQEQ